MGTIHWIDIDGTVSTETRDSEPTLQELQQWVQGYIELVHLSDGSEMFVNEDGKRLRLPINELASTMARDVLSPHDQIVGRVVVCAGIEFSTD